MSGGALHLGLGEYPGRRLHDTRRSVVVLVSADVEPRRMQSLAPRLLHCQVVRIVSDARGPATAITVLRPRSAISVAGEGITVTRWHVGDPLLGPIASAVSSVSSTVIRSCRGTEGAPSRRSLPTSSLSSVPADHRSVSPPRPSTTNHIPCRTLSRVLLSDVHYLPLLSSLNSLFFLTIMASPACSRGAAVLAILIARNDPAPSPPALRHVSRTRGGGGPRRTPPNRRPLRRFQPGPMVRLLKRQVAAASSVHPRRARRDAGQVHGDLGHTREARPMTSASAPRQAASARPADRQQPVASRRSRPPSARPGAPVSNLRVLAHADLVPVSIFAPDRRANPAHGMIRESSGSSSSP